MMRITLHINAEQIGDYEVRNIGEVSPGECRYSVTRIEGGRAVSEPVAHVFHYRAQGAESLAAKVMNHLSRSRVLRSS